MFYEIFLNADKMKTIHVKMSMSAMMEAMIATMKAAQFVRMKMEHFIVNVLKVTRFNLMAPVAITMSVDHTQHAENIQFVKIPQELMTVNASQ